MKKGKNHNTKLPEAIFFSKLEFNLHFPLNTVYNLTNITQSKDRNNCLEKGILFKSSH